MVESQIRTNKVTDERLIAAFQEIPRELFAPAHLRDLAYHDDDLPLGNGRYLTEPMILARLIQALQVTENDIVMILGGGTGYAAAILSRLAGTVIAADDAASLQSSIPVWRQLGMDTIVPVEGSLAEGCPRYAPYDAILVDGASEIVLPVWRDQLNEAGRLALVHREDTVSRGALYTKHGNHWSHRALFDAWAPVLPGLCHEKGFVFS